MSNNRTIPTTHYYTSEEQLTRLFEATARSRGLRASTLDEYKAWKRETVAELYEITGLNQMERCELEPRMLSSEQMNGYVREKWLIQTELSIWMPFYVLIPDGMKPGDKLPSIITPHGHSSGGKYSPAARTDIPAIADAVHDYNYGYGEAFVRQGMIVFCPDARGFGERREAMLQREDEYAFLNSTCVALNHVAISLGRSLTGMWTWDLMRLVDYISGRADCDAEKIGCGGLSGGGLQTLWLAAMDERIGCAIVSGYFYGYKDSLLKQSQHCGCNYVPRLWHAVDMGDIGALIAPRPLLIETGTQDPLNGERGMANVTEQVDFTRHAYRLWEYEERLYHHSFEGGHRWDGLAAYPFAARFLSGQ
ncbi:alpha/beta hydrolase family protein [Paenibacillus sp. OV219]|uniref:alpha/beta hydrolase family protein n=1 Tax=Paenibacillus sp. OV219 TaxID=1884377 RepID=UPI0008BDCFBD|nr:alpha/beta hydrolase family protein [Paenibacillus sp. OV219]SEN15228.1 Abhydrolase family protein [Paenibacillus sp. OV219]